MYYIIEFFIILRDFSYAFHISNSILWLIIFALLFIFFSINVFQNNFRIKKYIIPILITIPLVAYNKYAFSFISIILFAYTFRNMSINRTAFFFFFFTDFLFCHHCLSCKHWLSYWCWNWRFLENRYKNTHTGGIN